MSNTIKTAALLGLMSAVLMAIGARLGGESGLVAGFLFAVAMFFGGSRDDREGSSPIGLLLMMILAPIAAVLIQAAISRSREFDADAGGAGIAGSPHGLVSALRKIESASKIIPLDANPATAH